MADRPAGVAPYGYCSIVMQDSIKFTLTDFMNWVKQNQQEAEA